MLKRCISLFIILSSARLAFSEGQTFVPTVEPTKCHIQYYFAKIAIPTVGGNTVCQPLYAPDVTVCGFDLTGKPINLYSTYQDDIEELQQGLGFQNPDYVVGQTSRYVKITSETYMSLTGLGVLMDVALDMHGMSEGIDQFVFYGYNSDLSFGLEHIRRVGFILGQGDINDQGSFLYLPPEYFKFKYVIVTALSGGVMLGQLRYECLTPTQAPTLKPTFKPSFRPTTESMVASTREPTAFPTPCHVQYLFLKVGLGIDYHNTTVHGYYGNPQVNIYGYKNNVPANLYSKDEEDISKLDYGMGFLDSTSHEITPDGYAIYVELLENLENVKMSMCALDSQGDDYAWAWYGTDCLPNAANCNKKDVLIYAGSGEAGSGSKGWFFSVSGNGYSWKDFKYIKVVSTKGQVLLASVRLDCLTPTVQPSFTPTIWPTDAPVTIRPSRSPILSPSLAPSLEPTPCHIQYYFAKLAIPLSGGDIYCQDLYSPDVKLCGFNADGTQHRLYSTCEDDIPEVQQGVGLQNYDWSPGVADVPHYLEITTESYLSLERVYQVDGAAIDMHGMTKGNEEFIFYGWNGPLGAPLSDIIAANKVLGTGNMMENQGKFVALDPSYKQYKYVIITVKPGTDGKVMLGELRYNCLTPTKSPSRLPTQTPSQTPTHCHLQYMFLKLDQNPLPECQEHYAPGQTVTLCGYYQNSKGAYVPSKLWSNNQGEEKNAGMGLANVTEHAITTLGFIQLENVTPLLDLAFDMHSAFGHTGYIFYASNTPGIPVTHKDAVVLLKGTKMGQYQYLPDGENGNTLDYKKFKYLFVTSGNPDHSVLLFEMRYRCSDPSIRPTPVPTLKPTVKPSFRPTLMPATEPTQSECTVYNFDVPDLGIKFHSFSSFYSNGDLTVYGYTAGTKALLYSQSGGLGFEDTVAHEIAPGYAIYIEGLQSLEGVALSMQNVQGGDTWAWYGTDDFNSVDTPITFGSSDSGQLVPVTGSGKTWRDFKLIKVTALSGSVLLSGYQYCPPAKAV